MNPKLGFLHPGEMGISLAAVFFSSFDKAEK